MEYESDNVSLEDGHRDIESIVANAAAIKAPPGTRHLFWTVTQPGPDSEACDFLGLYSGEKIALQFLGQCAAVGENGIKELNPVIFAAYQTDAVLDLARRRWTAMCAERDTPLLSY